LTLVYKLPIPEGAGIRQGRVAGNWFAPSISQRAFNSQSLKRSAYVAASRFKTNSAGPDVTLVPSRNRHPKDCGYQMLMVSAMPLSALT
jgi:hypothetical protein